MSAITQIHSLMGTAGVNRCGFGVPLISDCCCFIIMWLEYHCNGEFERLPGSCLFKTRILGFKETGANFPVQ